MNGAIERALVIGGGPAGIEAALRIGEAGREVILIERGSQLGGMLARLSLTFPYGQSPQQLLESKLRRLDQVQRCRVLLNTVVTSSEPNDNGFAVHVSCVEGGGTTSSMALDVGAVVLATGAEMFDARRYGEYGYGIYPGVVTSLEFEDLLKQWAAGRFEGPIPKSVAFIKCVGSRDPVKGYAYCSKVCCMYTAKQSGSVRDLFPESKAFVFYMDYRAAGKGYEEFVRDVIDEKGVRYVRGRPSKVLSSGGRLLVRAEDTLMGVPVEVEVDMVVLAAAMVPREETGELAAGFGAGVDQYGFLETGPDSQVKCGERVFSAGAATFPMSIAEAQQQGAAAAAEVLGLLTAEFLSGAID